MQLANLHNDGKQSTASDAVFQRALKMTYETLVTSDRKVTCNISDSLYFEFLLMCECVFC